jgi:DNA-binding transcriptional LysR family regulator
MNLSQLEILVAVAETGSFTEAADRVGLTRSALSHTLANLETELGVAPLERGRGKRVQLPLATVFYGTPMTF